MNDHQEHLQTLKEIRTLMDRSSRFISLSGLSGVFAGIFALAGVAAAYFKFDIGNSTHYYDKVLMPNLELNYNFISFVFYDALVILIGSVLFGFIFTRWKAQKQGSDLWGATAIRMLVNLAIPLFSGGIYCIVLLWRGEVGLILPSSLLFYGLALLNASKYTLNDIRYLGISEVILGLVGCMYTEYGLIFWSIGFGILHIIYGVMMYFKYER